MWRTGLDASCVEKCAGGIGDIVNQQQPVVFVCVGTVDNYVGQSLELAEMR